MSKDRPQPWADAVVCGACGRRLLPLSYLEPVDSDRLQLHHRPQLKCPGCGQCYEWRGSVGWDVAAV